MRRREGFTLAGVMALCLVAGSLLAWMFLSLSWSQESLTAATVLDEHPLIWRERWP